MSKYNYRLLAAESDKLYSRPAASADILRDDSDPKNIRTIRRLKDVRRKRFASLAFVGAVGSANKVVKSHKERERLRKAYNVIAVEMESAGVAEAAMLNGRPFFVVRGICDYANDGKNDKWHGYAAMAAATFAAALIESMPLAIEKPRPCETVNYEAMPMRIATWNVNGLRSVVRRDFDTWLAEKQYDVVCLQEVKVGEDLLTTHWFDGYEAHWNSSQRAGHSGVATLVRSDRQVCNVARGIGHDASDVEGRVLSLDVEGVRVINVYAPHSHRKLTRLDAKLAFLSHLSAFLTLQREKCAALAVLGDLNVAHREIDLANPKANVKNAGFLPQERAWLDALLKDGFVDVFRSLHPEPGTTLGGACVAT